MKDTKKAAVDASIPSFQLLGLRLSKSQILKVSNSQSLKLSSAYRFFELAR